MLSVARVAAAAVRRPAQWITLKRGSLGAGEKLEAERGPRQTSWCEKLCEGTFEKTMEINNVKVVCLNWKLVCLQSEAVLTDRNQLIKE